MTRTEYIIDDDFLDDETKMSAESQGFLWELIRCKDCKHWDGVDTCDVIDAPVWDDDFCSLAERKEELDCNDCYYSMQNCNDRSVCCEDETALCDNFEPVAERKEE